MPPGVMLMPAHATEFVRRNPLIGSHFSPQNFHHFSTTFSKKASENL
jgi:hypothetical protein